MLGHPPSISSSLFLLHCRLGSRPPWLTLVLAWLPLASKTARPLAYQAPLFGPQSHSAQLAYPLAHLATRNNLAPKPPWLHLAPPRVPGSQPTLVYKAALGIVYQKLPQIPGCTLLAWLSRLTPCGAPQVPWLNLTLCDAKLAWKKIWFPIGPTWPPEDVS